MPPRIFLFRVFLIVLACGIAYRGLAIDVEVSRVTGQISLVNRSASSAPIAGYSINSASGSLLPANWLSIADNYDSDDGGLVDLDDNWTIISSSTGSLAEGQFFGDGGVLAPGQTLSLGLAWDPFRMQDLAVSIVDGPGDPTMVTPIYTSFSADFEEDLDVDRADLVLWRICFIDADGCEFGDADGNQVVNSDDFFIWLQQVGSSGPIPPPGSIGAPTGLGAAAVAIPEPTSIALMVLGLLALLTYHRFGLKKGTFYFFTSNGFWFTTSRKS